MVLACSLCVGTTCASADDSASSEELAIRVFRAVEFAEVNRAIVRRECRLKPQLVDSRVCRRIWYVSDQIIEQAALPYFRKYVTSTNAADALAFWSSSAGQELTKTLLTVTEFNDPSLLTDEQTATLDRFNKSDAGRAMSRFASDRFQGNAVIAAIAGSSGN